MLVSFKTVPESVRRAAREGRAAGWCGRGMSDSTHALLQRHVGRGLSETSLAALMWYLRNVLYFEQGLDKNPDVMIVRYEDLVTRPMEECKKVFDFMGLQFHSRIVRQVHAVSIGRRPPPELDAQVAALCESLLERFYKVQSAVDCSGGEVAANTEDRSAN